MKQLSISKLQQERDFWHREALKWCDKSLKWIPCKATLPERADYYLVTQQLVPYSKEDRINGTKKYKVATIYYAPLNGWWDDIDSELGWKIIAWQPLPEAFVKS